jgi:hypothetical protein
MQAAFLNAEVRIQNAEVEFALTSAFLTSDFCLATE